MKLNFTRFASIISALALLGVVLAAGSGRADVYAGAEANKQGDYATALSEFVDLAESGDPRAQYNLAVMYLKGRGVEKDLARAFELQRRAAEAGLSAAQHGLAIMYYRGKGAERDYKQAAKWFRRAADQGFPTSQLNLGVMYFSGQGVERSDAEVVKWITLAAAKGLPEALFRLGKMFEQGAVFSKSIKDAIYWFGKSGERGHQDGEKEARRLTALLATHRAVGEAGRKKPAAIDPDPNNSSEKTIVVDNSVAPRVPPSPPEPQIAKIVPETPAIPETRPEIHGWRVQLASFRTIGGAKRVWKNLKRAFAEEFEDLQPDIVRVDLGPKRGVYHRLRAALLTSRDAAFAF